MHTYTHMCILCIYAYIYTYNNVKYWGAWVAQSVKQLTSAQVIISWLVSSSCVSGSVLTAQSLESAPDSVSPSLCPSPIHTLSLSLSVKSKYTLKTI